MSLEFGEYLRINDNDKYECTQCGETLGAASENWQENVPRVEEPVSEMGVSWIHEREDLVFRKFLCPGCNTQLNTDVCPEDEPVLPWFDPAS